MIETILCVLVSFIENTIKTMGPWVISLLMAIESCNVPLPSEAILPFAGYLVTTGEISNIHVASLFGAIGCVIGSVPSCYLGYFGGSVFAINNCQGARYVGLLDLSLEICMTYLQRVLRPHAPKHSNLWIYDITKRV